MADMKKERRGLGRGLSALMADVNAAEQSDLSETERAAATEKTIPIDQIEPNQEQPRKNFDQTALEELADSMRERGIIQPLILRTHPAKDGFYQIVAGERRWRAAQIANLHELPAIVRDYSESEVLEIAIIENIQREELNAIEEAAGYRQLMDRFGHTQERVAEALGKSRSHIANLLRLLNLPSDVQDLVQTGALSPGHARALITVDDPAAVAKQVISKNMSVRQTEALAKNQSEPASRKARSAPAPKDADTTALENDLSAALGMKVTIEHKEDGEAGRISVNYKNLDDLDRICGLLSSVR